jgi:hypothetical protein
MLDGRITKFLQTCLRRGECHYESGFRRYVFALGDPLMLEETTLFVYPRERREWFFQAVEVWKGNRPDGFGGEVDSYDTEVRKSDDRKYLSSEEAARMLFATISAYDLDGVVSKESLKLLRQD